MRGAPQRAAPAEALPLHDAVEVFELPHRESVRAMGGLESLTVDLPDLLARYGDAEVEDGTVRLQLDGMVVDDLEQKLHDAARIARAFAKSATS